MRLPTREDVADRRATQFKQRITEVIAEQDLVFFERLVAGYEEEHGKEPRVIAAALAYLAQKDRPLLPPPGARAAARRSYGRGERPESRERARASGPRTRSGRSASARPATNVPAQRERPARDVRPVPRAAPRFARSARAPASRPLPDAAEREATQHYRALRAARREARGPARSRRDLGAPRGSVRYRIAVGHDHGVQPGNIVGAIANEAAIDSVHIGRIQIFDAYSTVDLPEGMPDETYEQLQKTWVCGQKLALRVDSPGDEPAYAPRTPRPRANDVKFDKRAKFGKGTRFDKPAKFERPAKKKHRKGPPPPRK